MRSMYKSDRREGVSKNRSLGTQSFSLNRGYFYDNIAKKAIFVVTQTPHMHLDIDYNLPISQFSNSS